MSTVERDLARHENRIAAEDRMEEARDRAVEVERERLCQLPLGEILNERTVLRVRLRHISDNPSWATTRIDLEAIVDQLALANVESEVQRDRRTV